MRAAISLGVLISSCPGGSSSSGSNPAPPTFQTPPTNTGTPYCGDGTCQDSEGESCNACPQDCDTQALVCGNGQCQAGESESTCFSDCGPDDWYLDWIEVEDETLALINERRAQGGTCPGGDSFPPSGPLTLDVDLREAARLHSWDTSYNEYLAHPSCNGRTPWNRAQDQGAQWSAENLARGYSSPTSVVNAWLNSDGHCRMLFNPTRTHGAVGYAKAHGTNSSAVWSFEAW